MSGGHVEMVGVLHIGLPGDRERQHDRLQGEHVEQRVKAVLVEQQEADQHQAAGEQMRDVEGEALHFRVLETNSSSAPRKPSIKRRADEIGHAEDAHLGDAGLEHAERDAGGRKLDEIGERAEQRGPRRSRRRSPRPQGAKTQMMSET